MSNPELPYDVHFGAVGRALPDWRTAPDDEDPDDEELTETPADVILVLGFDPKEFSEESAAANDGPAGADAPVLGKLLATARGLFARATAEDLQPLRQALDEVLQGDDSGLLDRARALQAALPGIATQVLAASGNAAALYRILSAAAATGLSERPDADPSQKAELPIT